MTELQLGTLQAIMNSFMHKTGYNFTQINTHPSLSVKAWMSKLKHKLSKVCHSIIKLELNLKVNESNSNSLRFDSTRLHPHQGMLHTTAFFVHYLVALTLGFFGQQRFGRWVWIEIRRLRVTSTFCKYVLFFLVYMMRF